MNKLIYAQQSILVFFLFLLVTIQGCKKEETTSSNNNSNNNKTILKYEIISPVPTLPDSTLINSTGFKPVIIYSGPSISVTSEYYKYSFKIWTKEIDITNSQRPFYASLNARCYVPVTTGTASMNIYVNGVLKANVNAQIKQSFIQDSVGVFDLLTGGNPVFTIN